MRSYRTSRVHKPTFDPVVAGGHLRMERERQGLTQREVAAKAGVSQKTVDNIEKAIGDASLKNIEAVALALDNDIVEVIQLSCRSDA
jgi:transcriptional regulator with XRE-family HTH domain